MCFCADLIRSIYPARTGTKQCFVSVGTAGLDLGLKLGSGLVAARQMCSYVKCVYVYMCVCVCGVWLCMSWQRKRHCGYSRVTAGACVSGEGPDRCTEHKHITGSKSPQGLHNDVSTPGCSEDAASSPACCSHGSWRERNGEAL